MSSLPLVHLHRFPLCGGLLSRVCGLSIGKGWLYSVNIESYHTNNVPQENLCSIKVFANTIAITNLLKNDFPK